MRNAMADKLAFSFIGHSRASFSTLYFYGNPAVPAFRKDGRRNEKVEAQCSTKSSRITKS
jgi:hypothetical protein